MDDHESPSSSSWFQSTWFQSTENESLFQGMCTPFNTVILNLTDVEFVDSVLFTRLQFLSVFVLIPIITILAVITNGSYLYVVAKVKSMQTVTNVYLCNLAVADTLFLLSTCAVYIGFYYSSGGLYGNAPLAGYFECIGGHFPRIFYVQSMALMVTVTLDRYYAVCQPLKHHRTFTKSRTIKITVTAWTFGVLFQGKSIPGRIYRDIFCVTWPDLPRYSELPPFTSVCYGIFSWEVDVLVNYLSDVLLFVFVMSANCFMYFKIIKALKNRPAQRDSQQGLSDSADRTRRRVTRMLLANTLVFFILTAPNYIHSLLLMIELFVKLPLILEDPAANNTIIIITNILAAINSMINPIIYNATNSRYRQAYREAFLPCCQTNDRQNADLKNNHRRNADRQNSDPKNNHRQTADRQNSDRQPNAVRETSDVQITNPQATDSTTDRQTNDCQTNEGQASDRQTNDRQTNDLQTNDRQTTDSQTRALPTNDLQTNDGKASDRQTNNRQTNDRQTNDLQTNDSLTNDRQTNNRQTNDRQTNDRQANDSLANDRQTNDGQTNDGQANDRQANDRQTNDSQTNDSQTTHE
ncbi:neuromedin-U receptor 2-like [Patiria miniata]|uniref:G-protein coupled receptors family 1 profile domain-containing protein n=1 Tax=Patiria miniata TaxID=46514 RepID=A0A914ARQ5_PATMI|nr:neuromedin-U receptor 2-like [Patiria miniata]